MELYAQSDMESMRDVQGKFREQLDMGDRILPAHGTGSVRIMGWIVENLGPWY
jgi:hypothetical protein